ncbi:MAG: CRISPR-associated helicase Cas3' [Oscillospiraceae bacterium]|nr:CRISPR-associated helicase Cas3' [Oscillospiraceae bacterium]
MCEVTQGGAPLGVLWAKKSRDGGMLWLPLPTHLSDTAETAKLLWDRHIADGVKKRIAASCRCSESAARALFVFVAAVHDLGKATPAFQQKGTYSNNRDLDERIHEKLCFAGYVFPDIEPPKPPHALMSQVLLEELGFNKHVAVIVGAHHGKPPDTGYCNYDSCRSSYGRGHRCWEAAQQEIVTRALTLAGVSSVEDLPKPKPAAQVLLTGLVIMADWIASNECYFPLVPIGVEVELDSEDRAKNAFDVLGLTHPWLPDSPFAHPDLYAERFGFDRTNAMQRAALEIAMDIQTPGIMVIEAPMGNGKTEAALAVTEIFAHKAERGGAFFALPTQATSDGIFSRFLRWINSFDDGMAHSVELVHGKAQLNEKFQKLPKFGDDSDIGNDLDVSEGREQVGVHAWFSGRKRAMLADFAVGTIDQVLLAALKMKHLMLRHLGLAGKVVIIDECHAYDAYMSRYLETALRWLGAYGVPVIVLSATLTGAKRASVISAYRGDGVPKLSADIANNRAYPLITYTDGDDVWQREIESEDVDTVVTVNRLDFDDIPDKLEALLSDGGAAGVIVNTVKRAQSLAKRLREKFGDDDVLLIHSRLIAAERVKREAVLLKKLGKPADDQDRPRRLIVVGTQVLEQSLDIDFDVLITDVCPMDLLLQRIGRLHRHVGRVRPAAVLQPVCYVTGIEPDGGFDEGSVKVYGEYLLSRTRELLPDSVALPRDIPELVEAAYDGGGDESLYAIWDAKNVTQRKKAGDFKIANPSNRDAATIVNWLSTDVSDDPSGKRGECAVRDTDPTIEVIAVFERGGKFTTIDGRVLPKHDMDEKTARHLARQSIRLPVSLSTSACIEELEAICCSRFAQWQQSVWLSGELFLVFDENNKTTLGGRCVVYSEADGLWWE